MRTAKMGATTSSSGFAHVAPNAVKTRASRLHTTGSGGTHFGCRRLTSSVPWTSSKGTRAHASTRGSRRSGDRSNPRRPLKTQHASACATPIGRTRASRAAARQRSATSTRLRQTPSPCATSSRRRARGSAWRDQGEATRAVIGSSEQVTVSDGDCSAGSVLAQCWLMIP